MLENNRRVVVTGMGVIAPNGIGIDQFWDSLIHGRSGVKKISYFDSSSYPRQVAAEVTQFEPSDYMDSKTAKRLDKFAQFALAAAKMAVEDSKLVINSLDPYKIGVACATGIGGGICKENQHIIFMEKGLKRMSPLAAVMICPHSAAGIISENLKIKGPNFTISSGCTSGLDAIYLAYNTIKLGDADIMLVGAGEAPITPFITTIFCAAGLLSKYNGKPEETVKPYDKFGSGTVLGEGGAVIVLEELGNAIKRGANIYGEILGYASCNEAYDIFRIDPQGETTEAVIKKAINNANLSLEDIEYINAHGNGSPEYDLNETVAIKKVFGDIAKSIPVTSIKPVTGQSFSVTGILQTITSLLVINHSIIPPTLNHKTPAPGCDLDYVPNRYRYKKVNIALINALGYGGGHTCIIVGKCNLQL